MSTAPTRRILYCHCAYAQVVPVETKSAVLERLSEAAVSFEAAPDLCEMSARRDPALAQIAADPESTIIACYPRAVRWLFAASGTPLPEEVRVLNMRSQPVSDLLDALDLPAVTGAS